MTEKEVLKAVKYAQVALNQDYREDYSEEYAFGVGDALEAVLRHLGLYDEYLEMEGDEV